jgi:hypothetical protein
VVRATKVRLYSSRQHGKQRQEAMEKLREGAVGINPPHGERAATMSGKGAASTRCLAYLRLGNGYTIKKS